VYIKDVKWYYDTSYVMKVFCEYPVQDK
jgi:hypothetical protein